MLDTIFGLPVHPLIVHATVVLIPLATAAVLMAGVWPRFRRWAGWLPLALTLIALVLTPLSTQSGESLQERVGGTALIREHAQLADGLLPWVAGLLVAAVMTTVLWRRSRTGPVASKDGAERTVVDSDRRQGTVAALERPLIVVAAAVAVVAAVGTTVQVVRIGHSGAEAAWSTLSGPRAAPPAAGSDHH